jgi:hypothetical protein
MFAGHVGAALVIGRAERRLNLGVFVVAAFLLDLVLWPFALLGWESIQLPADFARTHQPEFTFPYSHGLLAALGWSALAGGLTLRLQPQLGEGRRKAAFLVAAAVFSHWVLDALVHRPELPVAGDASPKLGLSLWNHLPAGLGAEAVIVLLGLGLFLPGCRLPRGRAIGLAVLTLLLLGFTLAGMTVAPPPPSVAAMAASSLGTLVVTGALFLWLGRTPRD